MFGVNSMTYSQFLIVVEIISAILLLGGVFLKMHKWYLKQEKQDKDISQIKEEQTLIVYGTLACLKGLKERGCNGPVTEAVSKIEKYINQQAHK